MDALLPNLRSGQLVIVSSMGSLSSLYLYERAVARGIALCVASFGTTALTARRKGPAQVNIMTRRSQVAISCLPQTAAPQALAACEALFGDGFNVEEDPLVSRPQQRCVPVQGLGNQRFGALQVSGMSDARFVATTTPPDESEYARLNL